MSDILDILIKQVPEKRESLENPKFSLSNPPQWFWDAIGVKRGHAGVSVTSSTALGLTAFWACVKILSETIASLPLVTYRQLSGDDKERARDRQEYRILHDEFNPQMTSMVAREVGQLHICTRGNAYYFIQFNKASKVMALWPLRSDKTYPIRKAGNLYYETTDTRDGGIQQYAPEDVLHVPGLSFDGIVGMSPIAVHRETIGHGIATESYGSAFFGEGGRPAGVLEVPVTMTDPAYDRLKKSFKEQTQDPHQTVILEEGTKYHAITVPPEDAQYIETRRFNISDMARIHRIPLAMLEEHDKTASYASVEQFFLQFAVHTMRPWLVRWEQEINRKIFGLTSELFVEHNIDGLLRGDLKSRYDAYHLALQDGWLTWDDVLAKENMNAVPGGMGKIHFVPANQIPVDRALNPPKPAAAPAAGAEGGTATRHGANGHAIEGGEKNEN